MIFEKQLQTMVTLHPEAIWAPVSSGIYRSLLKPSGPQDESYSSVPDACPDVCWEWAALALGTVNRRASLAPLQSQVLLLNSCDPSGQR